MIRMIRSSADGANGANGANGADGADGADGTNWCELVRTGANRQPDGLADGAEKAEKG